MRLFVVEVRHDGLELAPRDSYVAAYWLPATEWGGAAASWQDFRDMVERHMPLDAAIIHGRYAPGGLQVVSLKSALGEELADSWKGEIHPLKIESISKNLIRGRIGAVDAVIEREEYTRFLNSFPRNEQIQDHGALALGDVICGLFRAMRGPESRVQVSFTDALERIKSECEKRVREQPKTDVTVADMQATAQQTQTPLFHTPVCALSPLLFVENDDLCRDMWSRMLSEAGVEVNAYGTFEEALARIRHRQYKLAVLDVHLGRGATGHLGLELARELVATNPECRIVLSSADDSASHMMDTWGTLPVHGYIAKPALLDDWTATIDAAASVSQPTPLREILSDPESLLLVSAAELLAKQRMFSKTVAEALETFCTRAPGTTVHVFRLHPRSWRGRSVAHAGGKLNWEPYRGKLGKSLLGDAARSNEAVVYNKVEEGWRHRWTKAMVDYQSFWGQSLPVPGHYRHVLVAFQSTPGFFTSEMQLRARCCAESVTRTLSSELLERRGAHDAEQSSAGLGFACLAHEVYSSLNGIEMAIRRMGGLLESSEWAPPEQILALRPIVASLARHLPDVVLNARILRGPVGGDKAVSIVFCLEKALAAIAAAKQEVLRRPEDVTVEMQTPAPERCWMLKANAGALVTVFFNVLLNAVQQIEMFSSVRARGWVRITARYYEDARRLPWAVVLVSDSGPGIHPDDWESIFEAGYTTKEDGTGLGLHICRQLLSRIKEGTRQASIQIAQSVLWAGTTIAIRLPLSIT